MEHRQPIVLVVDDDEFNRTALTDTLEHEGYKVFEASNGKEALEVVAKHPETDCILLDILMPVMDGYETCKHLKSNPDTQDIPIIFLTAIHDQMAGLTEALALGVEDFIPKPFNAVALIARVKVMVKLRQNTRFLKKERDFNKQLIDNANAIIIVTDKQYNIVSYNQQAESTFGACIVNSHGKNLLEVLYKDETYRQEIHRAMKVFLDAHRNKFEIETSFKQDEREEININWSISSLVEEGKGLTNLIHIGKSLSGHNPLLDNMVESLAAELRITNLELDHKNRELELSNQKLIDLNKVKDHFLGVVSHDLRSPLNAILGFTDLLLLNKKNPLQERQRAMVEKIKRSGTNQLNLINDLLDVARFELGKIELNQSENNLNDIIKEGLEMLESLFTQKEITLTFQPDLDPILVYVDRPKILQVLNNLVSNAIKFTPKGGKIDVIVTPQHETIQIQVKDTGVGIPSDVLPKIFSQYNPVSTTGTEGEKGTGLGLAICKNMIEAHGGSVSVESKIYKGSTFTLILPSKE